MISKVGSQYGNPNFKGAFKVKISTEAEKLAWVNLCIQNGRSLKSIGIRFVCPLKDCYLVAAVNKKDGFLKKVLKASKFDYEYKKVTLPRRIDEALNPLYAAFGFKTFD